MLARRKVWRIASRDAEVMPPWTTSTLSSRASCCAYFVYSAMSDCESYWISLILRPSNPPASLICSTVAGEVPPAKPGEKVANGLAVSGIRLVKSFGAEEIESPTLSTSKRCSTTELRA